MTDYYNEHDPYVAEYLRRLIRGGHIAPGEVDERSIEDVSPADLVRFRQCHFFAGIGVWSFALRRARWPDDRKVWTGSCPCQPFSAAGEGKGFADERHLWPAWLHLIEQCRPPVVLGEQVASKDADPWIDLVHDDMEALGYAFGAIPFPSAGVGAPHIRDRLYWAALAGVALGDTSIARLEGHGGHGGRGDEPGRQLAHALGSIAETGAARGMGHAASGGLGIVRSALEPGSVRHADGASDASCRMDDSGKSERRRRPDDGALLAHGRAAERDESASDAQRIGEPGRVADAIGERHDGSGSAGSAGSAGEWRLDAAGYSAPSGEHGRPGPTNGLWRTADWLRCRDGKWRPVEPGTFPLAHGAPARVGRLRAYGNAINAEAAREWIEIVKEAMR